MEVRDLGCVEYEKIGAILDDFAKEARQMRSNILTLCTHKPIYTVGGAGGDFGVGVVQTDRGGSITYHDEGTLMVYFSFLVPNPPLFYKKVVRVLQSFFSFCPACRYDHKRPGIYIENRKLASLGFRYIKGVSKHGLSIHIDPDLDAFNRIAPCGLEGVRASSLRAEGIAMSLDEAKGRIVKAVEDVFET